MGGMGGMTGMAGRMGGMDETTGMHAIRGMDMDIRLPMIGMVDRIRMGMVTAMVTDARLDLVETALLLVLALNQTAILSPLPL